MDEVLPIVSLLMTYMAMALSYCAYLDRSFVFYGDPAPPVICACFWPVAIPIHFVLYLKKSWTNK